MFLDNTSKKKIKSAFDYANKLHAEMVVFVAPNEWEKGMVRVKYMFLPEDAENKEIDIVLNEFPPSKKLGLDYSEKKINF